MIYLKTYFYTYNEFKFLKLNLLESFNHIDKFIICEFNRTHTGQPRAFIFDESIFTKEQLSKILYLPCDISQQSTLTDNEKEMHEINEPLMRGYFVKEVKLNDDDIIISVDADEIIYEKSYPKIIQQAKQKPILLKLHQFFYKLNYHWYNKDFIAPTAIKYKEFKNNYPCQLRYMGELLDEYVGCHFSWCMTPEEMIYKLNTYAHSNLRHCANIDVLTHAIEQKKYPFDTTVDFQIREISMQDDILPVNIDNVR